MRKHYIEKINEKNIVEVNVCSINKVDIHHMWIQSPFSPQVNLWTQRNHIEYPRNHFT